MCNLSRSASLVACLTICMTVAGQFDPLGVAAPIDIDYQQCAVVLVDGDALIEAYTPDAECKLDYKQLEGTLSVASVRLSSDGEMIPRQQISFMVAIKNTTTGTIWMYSQQAVKEVSVAEIRRACKLDDQILILTVDKKYALPHNTISMDWKC